MLVDLGQCISIFFFIEKIHIFVFLTSNRGKIFFSVQFVLNFTSHYYYFLILSLKGSYLKQYIYILCSNCSWLMFHNEIKSSAINKKNNIKKYKFNSYVNEQRVEVTEIFRIKIKAVSIETSSDFISYYRLVNGNLISNIVLIYFTNLFKYFF